MDDRNDRAFFLTTFLADEAVHRCLYGSAGRCSVCGLHRTPERATSVEVRVLGSQRQHLDFEI